MTDKNDKFDLKRVFILVTAAALILTMCLTIFAACNRKEPEIIEPPAPLVVAFDGFDGNFNPFTAESENDLAVVEITCAKLLTTDRSGAIVYNAAEGETVFLDGKTNMYKGIASLSINRDSEDKTVYTWKLREDLKFSDGHPLTADDVIFTYYTLLDPKYDGPSKLSSVDIVGLQEYRTQTTPRIFNKYLSLSEAIYNAGEDHVWTGEEAWSREMQTFFWENLRKIWLEDIRAIVDYVSEKYTSYAPQYIGFSAGETAAREELRVVLAMAVWGFGSFEKVSAIARVDEDGNPMVGANGEYILAPEGEEGVEVKVWARDENGNYIFTGKYTDKTWDLASSFPTIEDYYNECYAAFDGDPVKYWETSGVDDTDVYKSAQSAFILEWGPKDRALAGKGIANIEGIKKLDDYTVEITTNGYSDTDIYTLGVTVAPLHHYGNESKYDYENNKFGFDFGNVSRAVSKYMVPLGAGPYKFIKYEDGVVYFEANEHYFRGAPKIAELQFKVMDDAEVISGVQNGAVDIASPAFSAELVDKIKAVNSNGELSGDIISTITVENPGYGYIGINADTVNVGGVPDGEASLNLRKSFAVLFAVYRDESIESYYGERAKVIDYPPASSLWQPPEPGSEDYAPAFSRDIHGEPLYVKALPQFTVADNEIPSVSMAREEKYNVALTAAVEYLKAAGYTWNETAGKFTLAPVGAKLEYEVLVPGSGEGDHPCFNICTSVKSALEKIGITLTIEDMSNTDKFWEKLKSGTHEMWCAAWEWDSIIGPDLYEMYHSSSIAGVGGSGSNFYYIQNGQLDDLIVQMLKKGSDSVRRDAYKRCIEIVTEWAIEIPVYQKHNCFIFSTERINLNTLTPHPTCCRDWMNDIELLEKLPVYAQKQ